MRGILFQPFAYLRDIEIAIPVKMLYALQDAPAFSGSFKIQVFVIGLQPADSSGFMLMFLL